MPKSIKFSFIQMPTTRSKTKRVPLKELNTMENLGVKTRRTKRKPETSKDVNKNEIKKSKSSPSPGLKKEQATSNEALNAQNEEKENGSEVKNEENFYLKQADELQKVLSMKYLDVVDRLQLEFKPTCIRDMLNCKNNHSKNCPGPTIISRNDEYRLNHLLSEKRPLHFLKTCNDFIQQGILLSDNLLEKLFNILIVNQTEDNENYYTNEYIINETKYTFINFINTFPPCWKAIRKNYIQFCTTLFDSSKLFSKEEKISIDQRNKLLFLISMIENTLHGAPDEKLDHINNSMDSSLGDSEAIFNYQQWENKHFQKNLISSLSREDKLDRLLISLDIIIKIFETDLSLWILRYLSKPFKHLFTDDKPLIVAAFLLKESNLINEYVLKVVNILIHMTLNSFPDGAIETFSRLLSLLSIIINLADAHDEEIKYPNIEAKSVSFANKIFDCIKANAGISFQNFIKILNNTKIPYIRLLLADKFLLQLDTKTSKLTNSIISPKAIYENLSKLYWQKYDKAPDNYQKSTENDNESAPKYPIYKTNMKKSRACEMFKEEYFNLYLECLQSYCNTFHTKYFILILMDRCNIKNTSMSLSSENDYSNLKIKSTINLERLEKDLPQMLNLIKMDAKLENLDSSDLPNYDGIEVNSDVMLQYRSDFKYLSLLKKNLPIMIEKFGNEFDIFTKFIDFCFTPEED